MSDRFAGRPAFIDPAPVVTGGEVGDTPAPRWFRVVALLLLAAAVWTLAASWSGPKADWPHGIDAGRSEGTAGEDHAATAG